MNTDPHNLNRRLPVVRRNPAGDGIQQTAETDAGHRFPAPLFIEQHPRSRRYAILEDNGTTLWLYLTLPDQTEPIADTWVFNRVRPVLKPDELTPFHDERPPQILEAVLEDDPVCDEPGDHQWAFTWTPDGEAVAVFRDDQPIAFVRATDRVGFSRHIIRSSPWGMPWSHKIFQDVFRIE